MTPLFPLDIAARAANLSEQAQVVSTLGPADDTVALTEFDRWRIGRLAVRLAEHSHEESRRRPGSARYSRHRVTEILTEYRRHELTLTGPDDALGRILTDLHGEWLPTYQSALRGLSRADDRMKAGWREFDVYYGRLAIACKPFLTELGLRLSDALAEEDGRGVPAIDVQVVDDFQDHLLGRFELALAWAVEAAAKAHCALHGIDPARTTSKDYLAYLDETFSDAASYHRFYLDFPVLGRWLAHVTELLAGHGREMIARLRADAGAVAEAFFEAPITRVRSLRLGRSDMHAGARSVAIVDVTLADGREESFVYKPRCVRGEAALQELLARLRDDDVVGYAPRPVLPRDGYGYEALIPSGRNRVETRDQAGHVYAELGGYLAIFYILGGGDLHFENVLVADGHAFICDCETVLGAPPKGQPRPSGTLMDSVFKTGLIEWPTAASTADTGIRLSGYSGGDAYRLPTPVPRVSDHRMSFEAAVTHRTGVLVEPGAPNRVFVGDELTRAEDFTDAIRTGFDRVYRWFQQRPEPAIEYVTALFAHTRVRFINWSTQVYAQLLLAARHPKCMIEPLEVDLLIDTVRRFPRSWDAEGVLPPCELTSMWRLDVPMFTVEAGGDRLVHDHRDEVAATVDATPLDHAAARIRRLSARNRAQQDQYIAAGLSGGDVTSPDFAATCVEQASAVGLRLCRMLREPDRAPWTSYVITGDGKTEIDIEGDLYIGSAGVALFLAHLHEAAPRPEFRRAAERALAHALDSCDRHRIGAFAGLGGLIYLLTHLHHLWGDRALLDRAVDLADEAAGLIELDRRLDVFHGVAGLIPVFLGLADATGGHGLEHAHRCAAHLMRHSQADGDTLSWPSPDPHTVTANLTGLSHGAGGIGWALIMLGCRDDRPDYVDAGRRAFAYEARHFDEDEQDWYDLRRVAGGRFRNGRHYANAWCNGAAGIGMTRISGWALLGKDDDAMFREARQALTATMRGFPRLMNDSLCHGRSGNAELFLRFAELGQEPAFRMEANIQAQAQWRNLEDARPGPESGFFPGLMLGLAGFGMHFLRLARPESTPSVLLLDPPGPRRSSKE
ncbi:type 2 lanthipeptide synthetase LanM family protein [Actinoallomurus soli]|uniref:type 2 lanthipeptide synthetase LanM family protein n=1 Tax=Actinoallomurus soli TaxID=2952535 RepID=UPI002093B24A|nr:type 2 lanthipeptide synthetase LanM family protein [Actinoallomurus soli]MCO5973468.1 type 2 lanthipeptide synthetase LanM family protein [Actinoallomurus soli]